MKPIVITFTSQKGGSGKTSATVSISAVLAEMNYKVLVVDGDIQMNTSITFGMEDLKEKSLREAIDDIELLDDYDASEYIHSTYLENVDIIPSSARVSLLENDLFVRVERERFVSKMVDNIVENPKLKYDFILFDTNPTLGLLNFNIFLASDYIVIPVECSRYGIMGVDAIIQFYKNTRRVNKKLKIAGVVLTKVDMRKSVTKVAIDQVKSTFGDVVFNTHIGIDTNIEKAQWEDLPVIQYDPKARVSMQYRELTKEVLDIVLEKEDARREKLNTYES